HIRRTPLKDASGVSMMDPKTQVSKIHNVSILDASQKSFESNLVFSLTKQYPNEQGEKLANIALNAFVNMNGHPALMAAEAARANGNSPNTALSAAIAIMGKKDAQRAMDASSALLEIFQRAPMADPMGSFDYREQLKEAAKHKEALLGPAGETCPIIEAAAALGKSVFIDFCRDVAKEQKVALSRDTLLAAIWTTLGWNSLKMRRITRETLIALPWYSKLFSAMVGATAPAKWHDDNAFCGVSMDDLISKHSFTQTAFMALLGREATKAELFEFQALLGLIITNGPGTISAQGAKGAVSADGPEQPDRVQINKGFVGFLTHTGFAHGGNGYEAAAFLIEQFKSASLKNPSDPNHGIDLEKLAMNYAQSYAKYKKAQKDIGNLNYAKIPCVNHPVFKGKAVNTDPREEFVRNLFKEKGLNNVFLDFYHCLVQALFKTGVSKNVYCVNVDAVIAVIMLKIVWDDFANGKMNESDIETASFATFLFGRMIGCAAEIDDHTNRGTNMDTRTPASKCVFVG
ncbi:MAG: CoA-binding protein, partial [Nitrospinales bacterium]